MRYRQLGSSGLRVSELTLGTMTFGGRGEFFKNVGDTDVAGARRQLDMALDAGVNLIDSSDIYSGGMSEEILGQVVAGRRDRVLIGTKVRLPTGSGPNDRGLSRHHLIEACEASLRRLGVDHIDLYQMHAWDGQTPLEETLGALADLVTAGKVRYIGCSNFAGWQLMKALAISASHGFQRFVSHQIYLSLQERAAERELVPAAIDQGLGLLIWSPLAGGWLSGKYRRHQPMPEGTRQSGATSTPPIHDVDALYDVVEELVAVAEEHAVSAAQIALAWLLRRPGVSSVIVGARTDTQLADNLAAADLELNDDAVARLERVSRRPLPYPYWMQLGGARDRLGAADLSLLEPYLG